MLLLLYHYAAIIPDDMIYGLYTHTLNIPLHLLWITLNDTLHCIAITYQLIDLTGKITISNLLMICHLQGKNDNYAVLL